jgi:hypothetical protein
MLCRIPSFLIGTLALKHTGSVRRDARLFAPLSHEFAHGLNSTEGEKEYAIEKGVRQQTRRTMRGS